MRQEIIKRGLGASEIAAVAGMDPHATPWRVWLVHTGQSDFVGNERTEWGHRVEPAIRQKYADVTGYVVEVPRRSLFHPERTWMRATPDGMIYDADRQLVRLFQAKNTGEWPAKGEWEDAPPEHVQLQEQWEMAVTGAPVADVCVLIGGNDWRMFSVHRDDAIIADLIEIGARFMERTAAGIAPEVDHSRECAEHLKSKLRNGSKIEWIADGEGERAIAEWKRLHIARKALDRPLEAARNKVLSLFSAAGCESIRWPEGWIRLQSGGERSTTDYRYVAELIASTRGVSKEELAALIEAATTKTSAPPKIAAPKAWGKSNDE